ncbi:MAG TPA: recombinase family protein [Symbiobacteriaceae bacterium]|nr:recombinase family protein [Symbiobacteriaceae bacterium]
MFASEEPRTGSVRAYVRVSTDEQAQEGHSLQTQRDEILRLVHYKWPDASVQWYEDDGWSAKDTRRPALERLRADVQPGEIVVALRLDRLTRSVFDLYTMLTEWDRRGIRFRSVREDYDTSTASGKFMIGLLALLAQWERERIAERVREVMAGVVTRDRRHVSKAPLGYDLRAKSLVVNDTEAALVRRIFGQYLAGQGTRAIAIALNAEGIRTKSGAEWTDFGVSYVLANPIYAGKVTWGRGRRKKGRASPPADDGAVVVDGVHPPLIDEATWNAVQVLKGRRRKLNRAATGQHALSGVARCGLCGGPMHGFVQRRYRNGQAQPGKERAYYRCSHRNHKESCPLPYIPADALEARVLEQLGALGDQSTLQSLVHAFLEPTDGGRTARLQADLKKLEHRRQRWDRLYEDGDISQAEWRERTAAVRLQQSQKESELNPASGHLVDLDEVVRALADLPRVWQALTPGERKVVVQGIVGEVIVGADGGVSVRARVHADTRPQEL